MCNNSTYRVKLCSLTVNVNHFHMIESEKKKFLFSNNSSRNVLLNRASLYSKKAVFYRTNRDFIFDTRSDSFFRSVGIQVQNSRYQLTLRKYFVAKNLHHTFLTHNQKVSETAVGARSLILSFYMKSVLKLDHIIVICL